MLEPLFKIVRFCEKCCEVRINLAQFHCLCFHRPRLDIELTEGKFEMFKITIEDDGCEFKVTHEGVTPIGRGQTLEVMGQFPDLRRCLSRLCDMLEKNYEKRIETIVQIANNFHLAPAIRKSAQDELDRYIEYWHNDEKISHKIKDLVSAARNPRK